MSEEVSNIQKVLNEIESFAYRYISKEEIALVCAISLDGLRNPEHPYGRAFMTGRIKRKAEFHDSIIQLSKQLSSPAMQIEQKIAEHVFINDSKLR